ncbi:PSD1 and planctomycete cytochrome C domain-containing protein [Roseimaritima ulvae]|uniref:Planctomycete cytochrome C n=1 Tax=Roseimaritima ulvae TaxID=980254 RepID=A0A5B9QUH1_9BACT|nr:PSD1 and planctomycete cytochrome C domain-containing protein [Roseimaritima ulvae]QEG42697.1 Planctomycete cytochrome C [Roseimaritima ulvae]
MLVHPSPLYRRFSVSAFATYGGAFAVLVLAAGLVSGQQPADGPPASEANASQAHEHQTNAEASEVAFAEQIRPLFNTHCIACHGGVKEAGGVSLILRSSVLGEADSGEAIVVPGDPELSAIMARVTSDDPYERMPPPEHGRALTAEEIDTLRRWIQQGAKWQEHWAYVPPQNASAVLAAGEDPRPQWSRGTIDTLVQRRWQPDAVPNPPAERSQWLRRVTLDLTGVPPSNAEYERYAADDSPLADGRVVDSLLASPRFAERWAAVWLDLARYADTKGYEKDPHRDIWPFRDWVIRAIGDDMPFDDFTIKQLAGDLLPQPSTDDLVATAFHRNTQTNTEGGTDDEEFRLAAVMDRLQTTFEVWQATTIGCVQCHSHPYDPIEHDEYYKLLAFFNTSQDVDLDDERPTLTIPSDIAALDSENRAALARLVRELEVVKQQQYQASRPLLENRNDEWQLMPLNAQSTGQTTLQVHSGAGGAAAEVQAVGTLTQGSRYTIDLALPDALNSLSAVRLDVLPTDVETARRNPETGFVVSRLQAHWIGGEPDEMKPLAEIPFTMVVGDDPLSLDDPQASLKGNADGWSAKPKISRPRTAVFVTDAVLQRPAGATGLRLSIEQKQALTGNIPLLIQRLRVSATAAESWPQWVHAEQTEHRSELIAATRKELAAIKGPRVPVMQQQSPAAARETFVFVRGNWLEKGDQVRPDVPAVLPPLPAVGDDPQAMPTRYDLARWLASPENPLTGRVVVNRVWFHLFGTGLVPTLEDFGSPGQPPTHPELLDDLASRFAGSMDWSVKRLVREIVLSAVYRQSATATAEQHAQDPHNQLLQRGPRNRLTAEMVRDQALMLSGLLSETMYGPSVMPPQPEGIWLSPYNGARWKTAEGADRYRRGLYTYWKRTSGYPSMLTFDATSRERCTLRRVPTNTPLQALVTMNDPVYVEAAQGLAERMAEEGGTGMNAQIRWAFRRCTGQSPDNEMMTALLSLVSDARAAYHSDAAAQGIAPNAAAYARFIVAHTLLNLDLTLTR